MTSILKVDQLQDSGGNAIITSDGAGNITPGSLNIANAQIASNAAIATTKLGTGAVLQVVQASTTTGANSTNNTAWVSTNLSASITPSSTSSKVLIVGQHGSARNVNSTNGLSIRLMRGATFLMYPAFELAYSTQGIDMACPIHWLDSPATTAATTYSTEFRNLTSAGSTGQINPNNVPAVMILMEIAG